MVKITAQYLGQKRTQLTHTPSSNVITTDAPLDNNGKGEAFSPTDLMASSLGACMMTVMGIYADNNNIDLSRATFEVIKHMAANPRRVSMIDINIVLPQSLSAPIRSTLEEIAANCPVKKSIHPDIVVNLEFSYTL